MLQRVVNHPRVEPEQEGEPVVVGRAAGLAQRVVEFGEQGALHGLYLTFVRPFADESGGGGVEQQLLAARSHAATCHVHEALHVGVAVDVCRLSVLVGVYHAGVESVLGLASGRHHLDFALSGLRRLPVQFVGSQSEVLAAHAVQARRVNLRGEGFHGFVGYLRLFAAVGTDEHLSVDVAQKAGFHEVDGRAELGLAALAGLEEVAVGGEPSAVPHSPVHHVLRGQQRVALVVVALHVGLGGEAVDPEHAPHLVGHQPDVLLSARGRELQPALDVVAVLPLALNRAECALHPPDVEVVGVHQP